MNGLEKRILELKHIIFIRDETIKKLKKELRIKRLNLKIEGQINKEFMDAVNEGRIIPRPPKQYNKKTKSIQTVVSDEIANVLSKSDKPLGFVEISARLKEFYDKNINRNNCDRTVKKALHGMRCDGLLEIVGAKRGRYSTYALCKKENDE